MTGARPTPGQFALVFSIFAILFAGSIFWPLTTDNLAFARTHATAWSMTLLAAPAFYIFARRFGREPLDNWWRLFWSFAWAMSLAHLWFGLVHLHDGDIASVFARQGPATAGVIFALVAIWGWDVFNAWFRDDWREDDILSRRFAFWLGAAAFFVSTVLFRNDAVSLGVGLILTVALATAALRRIDALGSWRSFFESPIPPAALAAILVVAALFGPGLFSTEAMTPADLAARQAKWTVWPALILGGVAVGLFIARAPRDLDAWGWPGWQIAGAGAYIAHVYAGFWIYFGGSFRAMLEAQGALVAASNWTLTLLWSLSALAAWRGRPAFWLHAASTAAFVISAALATYDRPGGVRWLGLAIAAVWLAIAAARFLKQRRW